MLKRGLKVDFEESIKYIANSILRISEDGNGNVIGISSSRFCKESKSNICEKVCEQIHNKGIDITLVDIDPRDRSNKKDSFNRICKDNISIRELDVLLSEQREENDIVIVNIPSVVFSADSVEYASVWGRGILLEKYMYTTYNGYEEALTRLNSYGVRIDGVVTYGA